MVKAWLASTLRIFFAPRERRATFALVVTLLFTVGLSAVHVRHEVWRDEAHCWSVGRNAAGLWDLMIGDRRYDGHPFLWYYAIYLASQISRSITMLHVLTIAIATAAAYLWLRFSQLPRLVRLLLLPSYMFFYEYSVVCRSYILGALLLFAFCTLYRRERLQYSLLALVLTLLALTSAYGAIMSGALAIVLFTHDLALFRKDAAGRRRLLATRPGFWPGLGLYVIGIVVTALTSYPPHDDVIPPVTRALGPGALSKALVNFWWAFVPTNTNWYSVSYLGIDIPKVVPYIPWFGAALFLGLLVGLRRAPSVAFAFAFTAVAMGLFQLGMYTGGLRHVGNVFLFALACAWLARRKLPGRPAMPLLWTLLTLCFLVQLKSAWTTVNEELARPFSGSLEAARYVARAFPPDTLLIGTNDFVASAVAGNLDRGFISADNGDFGQSVVSHNRRLGVTLPWLQALAADNLDGRERLLMILNFPVYPNDPNLDFMPRLMTEPSIVTDERYFIYEVRKRAH